MRLALRAIALVLLFAAAPARAVTFTKIAGNGSIHEFYGTPAVDEGLVAYEARYMLTGSWGIYASSGGVVTTVADKTTTVIPGRAGLFSEFSAPSVSNGNVAFYGRGRDEFGQTISEGIYVSFGGGALTEITGYSFPFFGPTPPGTLQHDYGYHTPGPALHDTRVAFVGTIGGERAIYTSDGGSLQVAFDGSTPLPTGDLPVHLWEDPIYLDSTGVAFAADHEAPPNGSPEAIYVAEAGSIARVVVAADTLAPGSNETFADLYVVDADAGNTAIAGSLGLDVLSLYAEIGGVLVWIADPPGGHNLGFASISDDRVAWQTGPFCSYPNVCSTTIHAYIGGQHFTVIEGGDVLDGRVVADLDFGPNGLSGDELVFAVRFADQTRAVYVADLTAIPEADAELMLAAGIVALAALRRRSAR